MNKKDTIAQAQSGTGKTATFSIGVLQLLDPKSPHCQAIILAPTRELAQQIRAPLAGLSVNTVISNLLVAVLATIICCPGVQDKPFPIVIEMVSLSVSVLKFKGFDDVD